MKSLSPLGPILLLVSVSLFLGTAQAYTCNTYPLGEYCFCTLDSQCYSDFCYYNECYSSSADDWWVWFLCSFISALLCCCMMMMMMRRRRQRQMEYQALHQQE